MDELEIRSQPGLQRKHLLNPIFQRKDGSGRNHGYELKASSPLSLIQLL